MNGNSEALERLARMHGIESSYVDATGERRFVSLETLRGLLEALGASASNPREIKESFKQADEARKKKQVEPVIVVWGEGKRQIVVPCESTITGQNLSSRIRLEDGAVRSLKSTAQRPRRRIFKMLS